MTTTTLPLRRAHSGGRRSLVIVLVLVAATLAVIALWPSQAATGRLTFDPMAMAFVETEGWRAYYDRNWARAIQLMLQLHHDVFGLRWPEALQASYYATRAQMAFAGANNNPSLAQEYLAKYYAVIAQARGLRYDPQQAAEAEMQYWIVHRQVAQRPDNPAPLVDAITNLHRVLFDIPADAARTSAIERTVAAQAVDRITGRRTSDPDAEWREILARLTTSYSLVNEAMGR